LGIHYNPLFPPLLRGKKDPQLSPLEKGETGGCNEHYSNRKHPGQIVLKNIPAYMGSIRKINKMQSI